MKKKTNSFPLTLPEFSQDSLKRNNQKSPVTPQGSICVVSPHRTPEGNINNNNSSLQLEVSVIF